MKKREITYRFHNPNPENVAADYLLGILIEANEKKVQAAIREAAALQESEAEPSEEDTLDEGMKLSF